MLAGVSYFGESTYATPASPNDNGHDSPNATAVAPVARAFTGGLRRDSALLDFSKQMPVVGLQDGSLDGGGSAAGVVVVGVVVDGEGAAVGGAGSPFVVAAKYSSHETQALTGFLSSASTVLDTQVPRVSQLPMPASLNMSLSSEAIRHLSPLAS